MRERRIKLDRSNLDSGMLFGFFGLFIALLIENYITLYST